MEKDNEKTKIVIIGGPTASGKSAFGVDLALHFGGEIISADSMQIYRGMDIGTGKITSAEMRGVRHRMIDIVDPREQYSTGQYVCGAARAIDEVTDSGRLPIVVGGTGLYINALISGFSFAGAARDNRLREQLCAQAEQFGTEFLHQKLAEIDPISAQKISKNDAKRIIRALEIFESTGRAKSESADNESPYEYLMLLLDIDRAHLYQKIEARVEQMLLGGLIGEVKGLNLERDSQAARAIGYKETLQFLDGELTEKELAGAIKINTRHYAKRQLTYFRNVFKNAKWIEPDLQMAIDLATEFLNKS